MADRNEKGGSNFEAPEGETETLDDNPTQGSGADDGEKRDGEETTKKLIRNNHTRYLAVELTEAELLDRGAKMAEFQEEIESISREEDRMKSAAKNLKTDREAMQNSLARMAKVVREKEEQRSVECQELLDFEEEKVKTVRLDTVEVIEERMMRDSDRQLNLFEDKDVNPEPEEDEPEEEEEEEIEDAEELPF